MQSLPAPAAALFRFLDDERLEYCVLGAVTAERISIVVASEVVEAVPALLRTFGSRNELDLIVRRGRRLIFVEVKERARDGFGGGIAAVDREKRRRVRRAAAAWLHANPHLAAPDVRLEVAAITAGRLERVRFDLE